MGEEIHYYLQCHLVNLKINMPNSLRDGWRESFKHGHSGETVSLRAVLLLLASLRNLENVLNTIFISNKTECKSAKATGGGTGSPSGLPLDVSTLATRPAREQVRLRLSARRAPVPPADSAMPTLAGSGLLPQSHLHGPPFCLSGVQFASLPRNLPGADAENIVLASVLSHTPLIPRVIRLSPCPHKLMGAQLFPVPTPLTAPGRLSSPPPKDRSCPQPCESLMLQSSEHPKCCH